jgi:Bacterial alpha-L-rhamnosidase 6 hairpin glycosidase domain
MAILKLINIKWGLAILLTSLSPTLLGAEKVLDFGYRSNYYAIQLVDKAPYLKFFSVDGLGKKIVTKNTIKWKEGDEKETVEIYKISDSEVEIHSIGSSNKEEWSFKFEEKKIVITSTYQPQNSIKSIDFIFDKRENHATLLGLMAERNKTQIPAVLHFPDMGTFQITADHPIEIAYDANRKNKSNFISVSLPGADEKRKSIRYTLTCASIYPKFPGVEAEKYEGYRRNYLNLFQINPRLQVIANNSCSDPCAFTLFLSSMLALKTPPLVGSLTALDLLRMSIERYLTGMKGYGLEGYNSDWENTGIISKPDTSKHDSYLDSYPSLVISACNYIKGSNDKKWGEKYYPVIKGWMDSQMTRDHDNNGLVEDKRSGDSGAPDQTMRPANWWDTIGYGHEDAFSNAITYDALIQLSQTAKKLNKEDDARRYAQHAEKLRDSYFKTFYNPNTGVLAGWKSKDGKLHDYWFLYINSMAVYYNLVPESKIKGVMEALWKKMAEAGFTDFSLGVPGNLVSIRREDYYHHDPRWGGGEKEDGSDAFQRYENGGASLNWSYFTLKALKKAGMNRELEQVSDGILRGIRNGDFQGYCGLMAKDWKTWNGECWGYEGFLCDGYLALLAINPKDK